MNKTERQEIIETLEKLRLGFLKRSQRKGYARIDGDFHPENIFDLKMLEKITALMVSFQEVMID